MYITHINRSRPVDCECRQVDSHFLIRKAGDVGRWREGLSLIRGTTEKDIGNAGVEVCLEPSDGNISRIIDANGVIGQTIGRITDSKHRVG